MTILVLQHVAVEGPGRVAQALDDAGLPWTVSRMDLDDPVPTSAKDLDGVVALGGPMGASDLAEYPRLADERLLLQSAIRHDVPVLGICLGAQLLAAAAGARVSRGNAFEIGWLPVERTTESDDDAVFGGLPRKFDALHWHGDVFDLPEDATRLASSELTETQAFRVGAGGYGALFHVEAHADQVSRMASAFPDDLALGGLAADQLRAETARHESSVSAVADQLLSSWVAVLGVEARTPAP